MNRLFRACVTPKNDLNILKRSFTVSNVERSTCHSIKKYHFHSNINSIYKSKLFSTRIKNYFSKNKALDNMINNLSNLDFTSNFKNDCRIILEDCKLLLEKKDIDDIYKILEKEYFVIENSMNKNKYYKQELVKTDILTAYLLIWGSNAETDIHFHASNGCYSYNLNGSWKETIYKNFNYSNNLIKKTQSLKSGDITYINNYIGAHQIKFLGNLDIDNKLDHKNFGFSINIYSPTSEI